MILVTSIQIEKVPDESVTIRSSTVEPMRPVAELEGEAVYTALQTEDVDSVPLVANGKRFRVGWSQQVVDALGVPLEVIKVMNSEITGLHRDQQLISQDYDRLETRHDELIRELRYMVLELQNYRGMSFWQRFKFLFMGRM